MGTFGRWLTAKLKQHDMSRAAFAERLEVTEQTIYAWIKGKAKPTDDKLDTIIDIFKADRVEVYFLAGKGYAGIEFEKLRPEYAQLAYALQTMDDAIQHMRVRAIFDDRLKRMVADLQDLMESITEAVEEEAKEGALQ